MDNKIAKSLRKKLDNKLIKLVAPAGMSVDAYRIACNLEGFDATIENGTFLHWIITSASEDSDDTEDKVHSAIVNALAKGYLLDADNPVQCAYFCDAICDVLLKDKDYTTKLLEGVFNGYKDSTKYGLEVFNYCKKLNKAFGFTPIEYFNSKI